MIESNDQLSVYVDESNKNDASKFIVEILINNHYSVKDFIGDADYVIINDLVDDFDLNDHRDSLMYALKNDKIICLASYGITTFNNGVKDILNFI